MHTVILYYKYTAVPDPKAEVSAHKALCQRLKLTGRVLIAPEGINGTLEGTHQAIIEYCAELEKSSLFFGMNIKKSVGTGNAFPKLTVKTRTEIVSSYLGASVDPNRKTGIYMSAEELHTLIESDTEFYIVDMRNDYETKAGYFEGSILSGMANFRDLPELLKTLSHLRDKKIVTVCTGGVRCEKASAFLIENGFSDVYQLKDGIVTYMETYPNQHFKGKLYVFDQRILVGFNTDAPDHEIVGTCLVCGELSERFVNCTNDDCHLHFICCEHCVVNGNSFCSKQCERTYVPRQKHRLEQIPNSVLL